MTPGNDYKRLREEVYEIIASVPKGKVLSYGALARLVGRQGKVGVISFYVTDAPSDRNLPVHRIVTADGRTYPKWPMQRALLEGEGVVFKENGLVDMKRHLWNEAEGGVDFSGEIFKAEGRKNPKKYEYDAVIIGDADSGGAYVVFPYDIRAEFGKGRVAVRALFGGEPYEGSVVNMGVKNSDGSVCYIIGIPKAVRSRIGKLPGDSVHVIVEER